MVADEVEAALEMIAARDVEIERLRKALEDIRASKMPGASRAIAIRALEQSRDGEG